MEEQVPFGSGEYWVVFGVVVFSRGMDFLSTWVATPRLLLEANPIARRLGWKWGGLVNLLICLVAASWPLAAIVISTTSLLVAARNFKSALWMRALGEERYRDWISGLMDQTSTQLHLLCVFGETGLVALVGVGVMFFGRDEIALVAIGLGILSYAGAVLFYTLLSLWRMRRRIG